MSVTPIIIRSRAGYIICTAQYKMKMWGPCSEIFVNFKMVTAQLQAGGPMWLHKLPL